jgi:hypothetical protein
MEFFRAGETPAGQPPRRRRYSQSDGMGEVASAFFQEGAGYE